MGFFTRRKPVDPSSPPAHAIAANGSKKIILNFRGGTKTVQAIATATLEAGGYVESPPREPHIGDKMSDGTVYAGASPDTGKPMYTTPAGAPRTMIFKEAKKCASKLDVHGRHDWRLPTEDELNVLFNNRAKIGGFTVTGSNLAGWYWTSTQVGKWTALGQRFSDGFQDFNHEGRHLSVRCVR